MLRFSVPLLHKPQVFSMHSECIQKLISSNKFFKIDTGSICKTAYAYIMCRRQLEWTEHNLLENKKAYEFLGIDDNSVLTEIFSKIISKESKIINNSELMKWVYDRIVGHLVYTHFINGLKLTKQFLKEGHLNRYLAHEHEKILFF
jgi:hypothetical protein